MARNVKQYILGIGFAVGIALLIGVRPAQAGAFNYGGQLRVFNCAMLNISSASSGSTTPQGQESNAVADRPGPYAFYTLNQRVDLRPGGWSLDNPERRLDSTSSKW